MGLRLRSCMNWEIGVAEVLYIMRGCVFGCCWIDEDSIGAGASWWYYVYLFFCLSCYFIWRRPFRSRSTFISYNRVEIAPRHLTPMIWSSIVCISDNIFILVNVISIDHMTQYVNSLIRRVHFFLNGSFLKLQFHHKCVLDSHTPTLL